MSQRLNLESPMGIALCWTFMTLAILFEVSGTTCLKLSDGFTRLLPSCLTFFFYALSLVCLNFALKKIDVGVAYATWSALGTALIASIGILWFREPSTVLKIVCLGLIIVGVVGLYLSGGSH